MKFNQRAESQFKFYGGMPRKPLYLWGDFGEDAPELYQKLAGFGSIYKGRLFSEDGKLFFEKPGLWGEEPRNELDAVDFLSSELEQSLILYFPKNAVDLFRILFENNMDRLVSSTKLVHRLTRVSGGPWWVENWFDFVNAFEIESNRLGASFAYKVSKAYLEALTSDCGSLEEKKSFIANIDSPHQTGLFAKLMLRFGELGLGWACYQQAVGSALRNEFAGKHSWWNGESLENKKVLCRRLSMGPGDEIIYAAVFNEMTAMGARLVIEVDWRLVSLFARSFPDATVIARRQPMSPEASSDDIDYQMSFSDSFRLLRANIEDFPAQKPYLVPDAGLKIEWQDKLREIGKGKKLVGLCWQTISSGAGNILDDSSPGLEGWVEILKQPDVQFVSLAYHKGAAEECAEINRRFGTNIYHPEGLDLFYDFEGMAALVVNLDQVLTIHCVMYSLANAVGTSTWLSSWKSYHMHLGQKYDPLYPEARVFFWDDEYETPQVAVDAMTDAFVRENGSTVRLLAAEG